MTEEIGFEAHIKHIYEKALELTGVGSSSENEEIKVVSQEAHGRLERIAEAQASA
jgi:hypothetical protein